MEDLEHRFKFHAASRNQRADEHESVRQTCFALADHFNYLLPEGRAKSIAITKLEEVMFWANAAIARDAG